MKYLARLKSEKRASKVLPKLPKDPLDSKDSPEVSHFPETTITTLAVLSKSQSGDKVVRIENGELKCLHPVHDMAAEIVKLTVSNLLEQKRLLLLHCQQYDDNHFFALGLKWESRVAALEKKMPRTLAEIQAAMELNLLAFLDKLKSYEEDEIEKYEGELP